MAITRKFLAALGIEPDKIDEILTAHLDTVNEIKAERDGYKADAEKLPGVQQELDTLKTAAGTDSGYEAQYNALKTEYEQYKADVEAERDTTKKKAAYREVLRECGIPDKRLDAVLRLIDADTITLGDDGKVADVENVKTAIKSEWADFIPADENRGAQVPTPPAGTGGGHVQSRAAQVARKHYEAIYGKKKES